MKVLEVSELRWDGIGTAIGVPKAYDAVKCEGRYYKTTTKTNNGRADWTEVSEEKLLNGHNR